MIGNLISAFFNFLLSFIMTVVSVICLPINMLFNNIFPDFSTQIGNISTGLQDALSTVSWAVSLIPQVVATTLLFIFTVELSLLVIFKSTFLTAKAWAILQKVKFW